MQVKTALIVSVQFHSLYQHHPILRAQRELNLLAVGCYRAACYHAMRMSVTREFRSWFIIFLRHHHLRPVSTAAAAAGDLSARAAQV